MGKTRWLEAPPVPKPPPYIRQPIMWIMLATLIALMVGMNLVSYFDRDSTPKKGYATEEWALRSRFMLETFSPTTPIPDKSLINALGNLEKVRKDDDLAEAYFAIISFETTGKVPDDSVAHLAKSKDAPVQTLAKIYGSKKLSKPEAATLKSSLPKETFRYRIAAAHALQKAGDKSGRANVLSPAAKFGMPLLLLAIAGVIMLGTVFLFGYAIMYANGRIDIPGHPAGELDPSEADQFAGKAAQLLTMFLAMQVVVGLLAATKIVPKSVYSGLNLFLALLIILGTVLMLRRDPISLRRVGWSKEKFGTHILWGLGAAVANAPVIIVMALLGSFLFRGLPQAEHPIESALTGALNPFKLITLFVLASVQAPIFEETTFRGLFQPALQGIIRNPWIAGVISSICFAAVHPTGIPAWPPLAAIGGMSVFLTYQTKSLVPSMIMHCVHNAATLVVAIVLLQT